MTCPLIVFALVWNWYEIPNNDNFYYYRLHAPVLQFLLTFWGLAPLALIGLLLALRRLRTDWPIVLIIGLNVVSMLAFYVLSRFRISLIVAMIPLAAFALTELVRFALARDFKRWGVAVCFPVAAESVADNARPSPDFRSEGHTDPFRH